MDSKAILHRFFTLLEARPAVGGLEVSDAALRFVASGVGPALSVRLEPGIFVGGKVADEAAFLKALLTLREQILGRHVRDTARLDVVVSLSSAHIYSQVFALPFLEGEKLEKAVDLNLKMALPGGSLESYSGWQILAHNVDSGRIEILAAFLEKRIADDLTALLRRAHFSVLAIESRALSLARLAKQATSGPDTRLPTIIVSADTSGLDVIIVRDGNPQFDYFNSWKDLQEEKKEMTLENFRLVIIRSVTQIINFYSAHWKEPLGMILVSATGMQAEIVQTISANFSTKVQELVPLVSPPLTSEWFVALGAAFRGRQPRREDVELSLLGVAAREEFRREQIDNFLSFWRLLIPLALGVLLAAFLGAWFFLSNNRRSVEAQAVFRISPEAAQEIKNLQQEAQSFNDSVSYIAAANALASPKAPILTKIMEITARRNITIGHLQITGPGTPVILSGSASSEGAILAFKNELAVTPGIKNVVLSLTDIQNQGDHFSFSTTFIAS